MPKGDLTSKTLRDAEKKFPASRESKESPVPVPGSETLDSHSLRIEGYFSSEVELLSFLDELRSQVAIHSSRGGVGFSINIENAGSVCVGDYCTPYERKLRADAYELVKSGNYPDIDSAMESLQRFRR